MRWWRAGRSATDRPALVTRPIGLALLCPGCGCRFSAPSLAMVPCPRCGRTLRPVLAILDGRTCKFCGQPLDATDPRVQYCDAKCRARAHDARRATVDQ